jgi:methenyltetrahydromethanopterin cyclohydrolase
MIQSEHMSLSKNISINQLSQPLVTALINDANALNLKIYPHETGATIVDAGIEATGGLEVGRRIAEICMGGLGQVTFVQNSHFENWPAGIQVTAKNPVLACLGSQYAGWALSFEKFFSLGSGPARSIAQREDVFTDIQYKDSANKTVLILETDKIPPVEIIAKVARDTNVSAENLTFILTPTRSLAGTVQIVARVLEVALHKLHTLHFPLNQLVDGIASAPLPPPSPDFLTGMGRTNDAILFGGFVQLFVQSTDEVAKQLAADLPSSASKDYGKPFAQVFKAVNMDFYQIDPLLFSPAKVTITNLTTGNSFFGGAFNEVLLNQSFGA